MVAGVVFPKEITSQSVHAVPDFHGPTGVLADMDRFQTKKRPTGVTVGMVVTQKLRRWSVFHQAGMFSPTMFNVDC